MNIEQIHDMLEDGIDIVKSSTSDIRDIADDAVQVVMLLPYIVDNCNIANDIKKLKLKNAFDRYVDGITNINNVLEEIKRIKNQKYYFDTEIKVLQSEDDLRESYRESEKPEDSTFEDYVDYLVNFAGTLIEVDELRF